MSCRLEPAIWSRDTGQLIPCFDRCQLLNISVQYRRTTQETKAACLYQPIIWSMAAMLRDSTVAAANFRFVNGRRRSAYAPTSKTATHDNHEKISSWVSFSLYGYGVPLGGPWGRRSSTIMRKPNSIIVLLYISQTETKRSAILFLRRTLQGAY